MRGGGANEWLLRLPRGCDFLIHTGDHTADWNIRALRENHMDIFTPSTRRRSTRLRVEIPLNLTSMDRRHPLTGELYGAGGERAGLRGSGRLQALPLETPVLLSALPGGGSAAGRVASCRPIGANGEFLIGVALYNPANVWGIANPPEDWQIQENFMPASQAAAAAVGAAFRQQAPVAPTTYFRQAEYRLRAENKSSVGEGWRSLVISRHTR